MNLGYHRRYHVRVLTFALCRDCGRDAFALYHFGWSDEQFRAHDFDARQDERLPEPKISFPESELPY